MTTLIMVKNQWISQLWVSYQRREQTMIFRLRFLKWNKWRKRLRMRHLLIVDGLEDTFSFRRLLLEVLLKRILHITWWPFSTKTRRSPKHSQLTAASASLKSCSPISDNCPARWSQNFPKSAFSTRMTPWSSRDGPSWKSSCAPSSGTENWEKMRPWGTSWPSRMTLSLSWGTWAFTLGPTLPSPQSTPRIFLSTSSKLWPSRRLRVVGLMADQNPHISLLSYQTLTLKWLSLRI